MNNLLEQWNEYIIRGNQLSRDLEGFDGIIEVGEQQDSEIAFVEKGIGATYISVLSPDAMRKFKNGVLEAIYKAKVEKETELKKLMGMIPVIPPVGSLKLPEIPPLAMGGVFTSTYNADATLTDNVVPEPEKRKPAIINPEFEAAVQGMVESVKHKQKEAPQDDKSLDKYPAKKSKPSPYPENMTEEAVKGLYINQGKTIQQVANHFGIPYAKANSFITGHKLHRNQQKPAETERP